MPLECNLQLVSHHNVHITPIYVCLGDNHFHLGAVPDGSQIILLQFASAFFLICIVMS